MTLVVRPVGGRRLWPWLALCAAITIGPALVARQSAPRIQQPSFRVATDFVAREVVVRDRDGRFVTGLTAKDFRVLEDGVAQTIEWLSMFTGNQVVDAAPKETRTAEGLIVPAPKPPEAPGRIWIVFIDDLHLQPMDTPRVRQVLEWLGDDVIHDGDMIAMVSTGYSSIALDLRYDPGRRRYRELIKKVAGNGVTPAMIVNSPSGSNGPAGLRYNAHVAFSTAYDLLAQAEAIPNRKKAFLYVSSGYDFDPYADSRIQAEIERWSIPPQVGGGRGSLVNPFAKTGNEFSEADLIAQLAELSRAANRANTTFHTIDPRGLDAGPGIDTNIGRLEWAQSVEKTTSSLRMLAQETGGIAVVNTNDFRTKFRAIDDAMSDYYILGYLSTNKDRSQVTRRIEITVPGRDLTLRYQDRYAIKIPK